MAEKGDLVFVFNFHPVNSYSDYRVGVKHAGPYKASPCTGAGPPGAQRARRLSSCASLELDRRRCAQIALSSDEAVFGGYENVSKKHATDHHTQVRSPAAEPCTRGCSLHRPIKCGPPAVQHMSLCQ